MKNQYRKLNAAGKEGLEIWRGKYRLIVLISEVGRLTLTWYSKNRRVKRYCNNITCIENMHKPGACINDEICCTKCNILKFDYKLFVDGVKYGSKCEREII